jgi:hypothetical protein
MVAMRPFINLCIGAAVGTLIGHGVYGAVHTPVRERWARQCGEACKPTGVLSYTDDYACRCQSAADVAFAQSAAAHEKRMDDLFSRTPLADPPAADAGAKTAGTSL